MKEPCQCPANAPNVEAVLAEALEECEKQLIEIRDSPMLMGVAAVIKAVIQKKVDKARAALALHRKAGVERCCKTYSTSSSRSKNA